MIYLIPKIIQEFYHLCNQTHISKVTSALFLVYSYLVIHLHPTHSKISFSFNRMYNAIKKTKKKLLFTLDLEGRLIQSKNKKRNESKPTLGKFLRRSFRQSIKFRLGFVRLWRYYQLEQNFYNSKCVFPCVQASTYTGRKKMVRVILNLDFHVFEDIGEFQLLSP